MRLPAFAALGLLLGIAPALAVPALNGYKTEAEANHACGAGKVVWLSKNSKVYHRAGDRYFGKTKGGEYMCLSTAQQAGLRQAGAKKGQGK